MDSVDLQIVKILLENCRTTYRQIGETLHLSVNAIYKRVQAMIDTGVIRAFTARPSLIGLKAINVLIFGQSKGKNLNEISKQLGNHESIFFVGNAGGNYLYIDGYLRNINELDEYTVSVSDIAVLEEFSTCIKALPFRINPEVLTKIDFQILRTLGSDAKRTIADLAKDLGITAKTIRKRVKRMREYNLVEFSINFAPQNEGTIVSQFHIYLDKNSDHDNEINNIKEQYNDNLLYLQRFTNIPNLLMLTALSKSNKEAADLYSRLQAESHENVEHHIIYNGFFFETWRDKLFQEKLFEI
jgi:Lrp/AsnC family leucine-responsive transcriptional regulator